MPHRGANTPVSGPGHKPEVKSFLDDDIEERKPMHSIKNGGNGEGSKLKLIVGAVGAVIVIAAIIFIAGLFMRPSSGSVGIDNNKLQAVFFTNGQVYFGKLKEQNAQYMKLSNIFYLQTQDDTASKNVQKGAAEEGPNVQLIKLGNEIHGPADEMIISRDQILFFENLKDDGKVAQTINKYQGEKK